MLDAFKSFAETTVLPTNQPEQQMEGGLG